MKRASIKIKSDFEFPALELDEGSVAKFLDRLPEMQDTIIDAYYLSHFNARAKNLIIKFKRELKILPEPHD